ncbi:MAG TPA: WSD1 family O-acyltransferase, partial [Solirubrobacteraceae bacterium]|nr:WSD1 family O-acyltransferase [Solirubrobacteraceae bacterium]
MRGPLPVYVEDPVARLQVVRHAMDGLKDSKQALGAEVLAGMQALAPPRRLGEDRRRLNFSTRLFNLLVTNVPGPQLPLYVLGRKLQDLFPVAFLPKNHALSVAIMSYDGGMDFGLLGDYDAMPDLDRLGEMLSESLAELLEAADGVPNAQPAAPAETGSNGKGKVSSRARTSRPRTSSRATTEA